MFSLVSATTPVINRPMSPSKKRRHSSSGGQVTPSHSPCRSKRVRQISSITQNVPRDAIVKIKKDPAPFKFLELPAELRNEIYRLAVCEPRLISIKNMPRACPLSHVNRQIRSECLPIYLTLNRFEYNEDEDKIWNKAKIDDGRLFAHYPERLSFRTIVRNQPAFLPRQFCRVVIQLALTPDRKGILFVNGSTTSPHPGIEIIIARAINFAFLRYYRHRSMTFLKLMDLARCVRASEGTLIVGYGRPFHITPSRSKPFGDYRIIEMESSGEDVLEGQTLLLLKHLLAKARGKERFLPAARGLAYR